MAIKSSKAETEQRVNEVYSLLLSCASREQIIEHCGSKWGIKPRTTDTLIREARERLLKVLAVERESALAEELELRREIIRRALAEKKYQIALQAADSRAKLRGLFVSLDQAVEILNASGFIVTDPTNTGA